MEWLPFFSHLSSTSTASVINTLKTWINVLGWPLVIRSDGGPRFRREFSEFCKNFRMSHELSSPYNPRASCPFPSSFQLSTTEGIMPSASVSFLAAGGTPSIPSAIRTPFHTGRKLSMSSGNPASLNLTPRPTLLSGW